MFYYSGGNEAAPAFQLRYWARVTLDEFVPLHETIDRVLVAPEDVAHRLGWVTHAVLKAILDEAMAVETSMG